MKFFILSKSNILIFVLAAALVFVPILILKPQSTVETITAEENAAAEEMDYFDDDGAIVNIPLSEPKYIKWVEFNPTAEIMKRAIDEDVKSQKEPVKINYIEVLSYLGAKYGGTFTRYKSSDMTNLIKKLKEGHTIGELTENMKYYNYYHEAYSAVLAEFVGTYKIKNKQGEWVENYGLKAFSPIAEGYGYSHFDDFGASRTYGYARQHLGNDMLGSVGTPIVAVESGVVEELGWNQYGGWRIGIRSFDKKRYYYYAHLRKDAPYNKTIVKGGAVKAGDVIGYLGMTGYSVKENVNNIKTPHLHIGLQLIFDESQKDGINQIWIDMYQITRLLDSHRSTVYRDPDSKDFFRQYEFVEE